MKAPICIICKKWVSVGDGTGDYVAFKVTDNEQLNYNKQIADGMFGHSHGLEMFCNDHLKTARQFAHLTWEEAQVHF